jgi:hypothetical protein
VCMSGTACERDFRWVCGWVFTSRGRNTKQTRAHRNLRRRSEEDCCLPEHMCGLACGRNARNRALRDLIQIAHTHTHCARRRLHLLAKREKERQRASLVREYGLHPYYKPEHTQKHTNANTDPQGTPSCMYIYSYVYTHTHFVHAGTQRNLSKRPEKPVPLKPRWYTQS